MAQYKGKEVMNNLSILPSGMRGVFDGALLKAGIRRVQGERELKKNGVHRKAPTGP